MAHSTPLARTSPVFLELEQELHEPQPMCLLIVTIVDGAEHGAAAEFRLRENMRDYDQLWRLDDCSFAMTLKTLADAKTLAARIERLFLLLSEPYVVGDGFVQARVRLGAAVRLPQDSVAKLLDRVGEALDEADDAGCIGPVIR